MKGARYIWLILIFLSNNAISSNHIEQRKLSWKPIETISLGDSITFKRLSFEDANYENPASVVPYYSELMTISPQVEFQNIKLTNPVYEKVSAEEKELLKDKNFPSEPELSTTRLRQRQNTFQKITFVPFVQRNGKLYKLKKFGLSFTKVPGKLKKESYKTQTQSSVLSTGNWYKLRLKDNGIYKITYEFLEENEVNVSDIEPDKLGIFGNTGKLLPEKVGASHPRGLTENPIKVKGGEDGSFDPGDYILFFGHGPVFWEYHSSESKFRHQKNYYTDSSFYFLTTDQGSGKRLVQNEPPSDTTSNIVEAYDHYQYYENDRVNIIESGRIWYGEKLDNAQEEMELPPFEFKNVIPGSKLHLKSDIAVRSNEPSKVLLHVNEKKIYHHTVPPLSAADQRYFRTDTKEGQFDELGDNYTAKVTYPAPSFSGNAWLNWVELSARCKLRYENQQLLFRDKESAGTNKTVKFRISNSQQNLRVWDVSNPVNPRIIETTFNNNTTTFTDKATHLHQYIAFSGQEYLTPEFEGAVRPQNLQGVKNIDYLIITHPDFRQQANRLARHHREHDGMECYVTTPNKIYNEFSSGGQDITAIRNFARHLYLNSDSSKRLKYMLLFGNGSYDYKGIHDENTNMVPTFQSYNSNSISSSYLTDDYFGLLNEGEGHTNPDEDQLAGLLDVGIGRLPAVTQEDAKIMVDKIIHYSTSPETLGHWRNQVCIIADDEDNNIHLRQAEQLAYIVDTGQAKINLQKIYLDAYRQESSSGGERYPEVNAAINARMDKGALIMNYVGHGGETGLAHERIITTSEVEGWKNYNRLPLFITATCEFSRFDNPEIVSAGEKTLLNPDGGSIGLLSTTRLAFSHSNFILNKRVFFEAFKKRNHPRLGDLVISSKTPMSKTLYNFVLLGDPAMTLAYPEQKVVTTSVKTNNENSTTDTIRALEKVFIEGAIKNHSGEIQTDFSGELTPVIFDKKETVSTRGNDPRSYETNFEIQNNILYKGKVSVTKGKFEFTFVVPKDINYRFGKGKLSYYASSETKDAAGADTSVVIGGSTNQWEADNQGPEIEVYMNDSTFKSGDRVNPSPVLKANVWDENGLNTTGNSIGHDLSAKLNGATEDMINLNEFYTAYLDSFKGGQVRYPFNKLPEGEYKLTLKAWDVYNNSSEKTISFMVSENIQPAISNVKCYPNPFSDETNFEFTHNQFRERLEVIVKIYSLQGQLIREIGPQEMTAKGYGISPIKWDGKNRFGNRVKKGMYIYSIIITENNGDKDKKSGKLIKTN